MNPSVYFMLQRSTSQEELNDLVMNMQFGNFWDKAKENYTTAKVNYLKDSSNRINKELNNQNISMERRNFLKAVQEVLINGIHEFDGTSKTKVRHNPGELLKVLVYQYERSYPGLFQCQIDKDSKKISIVCDPSNDEKVNMVFTTLTIFEQLMMYEPLDLNTVLELFIR